MSIARNSLVVYASSIVENLYGVRLLLYVRLTSDCYRSTLNLCEVVTEDIRSLKFKYTSLATVFIIFNIDVNCTSFEKFLHLRFSWSFQVRGNQNFIVGKIWVFYDYIFGIFSIYSSSKCSCIIIKRAIINVGCRSLTKDCYSTTKFSTNKVFERAIMEVNGWASKWNDWTGIW